MSFYRHISVVVWRSWYFRVHIRTGERQSDSPGPTIRAAEPFQPGGRGVVFILQTATVYDAVGTTRGHSGNWSHRGANGTARTPAGCDAAAWRLLMRLAYLRWTVFSTRVPDCFPSLSTTWVH